MSTWGEIREQALTMLDVTPDASTDDDIRNAVDKRMVHVRDRLYNLRCPDTLLVTSSAVTIDVDNEHVKLVGASATNQPSFELTNFRKLHAIEVEEQEWSFVSYPNWIRQRSAIAGNQIWEKSYTVYQGNQIIFKSLPSGSDTWDVVAHYKASPAAIIDGGEPELSADHHEFLILEVVLGFPNKFVSEERLALFAAYSKQREELKKLFMQDSLVTKGNHRMKPFVRKYAYRATSWGNGDL